MKLVNLTLPKEMQKRIAKIVKRNYVSEGEFVRSSIVKLLSHHDMLTQSGKIDLLRRLARDKMSVRGEKFDQVRELKALRKVREEMHARRS